MSKIVKKFVCLCFSAVVLLLTIATITSAKECNGDCAVWSFETQTIHISSLRIGEEYYWADFKLVTSPPEEGLFFELCPDYGYSEQANDNCSVWNPETQTIHISSLLIGEVCYWVDLFLRSDLGLFQFTDWCHSELNVFGLAFNVVDGLGNWRENLAETAEFSNLAMVASDGDSVTEIVFGDAAKINAARQRGMKSMVVITNVLFIADFYESGALKDVRLRDDYCQRLVVYAGLVSFLTRGADIWGFYILDEPYWAAIQVGMPISQMRQMLNEAISALKNVFPSSKSVGVIAVTQDDLEQKNIFGYPVSENDWQEYAFPNFDVVGVYCYWTQFKIFNPNSTLEDFKRVWQGKYMGNANQFLLPWQKIVLVPGTFGFTFADMPTEEDFLDLAKFYWNIAKTDSRVIAVVPFLWPSSGDLIGLRDLSPEVLAEYSGIGRKIKSNN